MKIYKESLDAMLSIVRQYTQQTTDMEIERRVYDIIENVRANGDAALREYSEKFDGVKLDDFKVDQSIIDAAWDNLPEDLKHALLVAKKNITEFHSREIEQGFVDMDTPGITRGQKVTPLARVGLYVPGGTAAYPSTIMMTALPAKIAGVKEIIMVTPPQKDGINPAVLGAAKLAGVDAVYQVGGAQGVAALAYGTEQIPKVDKIDMIAGPSEIGVIADDSANPVHLGADLLSQAEHDPRARAIMVTNSEKLAQLVSDEVERQLSQLPRESIARPAIENNSYIAVMDSVEDMFTVMNEVAPEHLEIQLPDPMEYMSMVENAGSVFLGRYASEPLGDYVGGTNHVLPTSGTAKFSSPLGVYDFVKRISFTQFSRERLQEVAKDITTLARTEGLEAHARAIEVRFEK